MPKSIEERFWEKVDKTGDCWLWLGALTDGYGQFGIKRKNIHAHRFSYELIYGPIINNLFVLHKCDNPSCVNPEHLSLGTNADNMQDAYNKGRGPNQHSYIYKNRFYVSKKELWRQHSKNNVSYKTFIKRLVYLNWDIEKALTNPSYKIRRVNNATC